MTQTARKIKVALAGVGNCASSLVQGVEYYRDADPSDRVPGLMHVMLGGYHVGDIEFVAAFDVDAAKVGLDLSKAVFASNNNTIRFSEVPASRRHRRARPDARRARQVLPRRASRSRRPHRSTSPTCCAEAAPRCSSPTSRSAPSRRRSTTPRPPSKPASPSSTPSRSSSPATPSGRTDSPRRACRSSATTSRARSAPRSSTGSSPACSKTGASVLDRTYQLNVGGNMDFRNMLERERLESKKISKTQAVTSQIDRALPEDSVHIGPSDHVPWLEDRKVGLHPHGGPQLRRRAAQPGAEARGLGLAELGRRHHRRTPLCRLGLDRGMGGPLIAPSAYFMKSPPVQFHDDEAYRMVEEFANNP